MVLFEGWIVGYDGQGYGRILPFLDWHLHLAVQAEVARRRRFAREAKLREETGGGFSPEEMQRFWDEVLGPGMDTWVPASAEHADIVVQFTDTGPSCVADPRLDEFLPDPNATRRIAAVKGDQPTEEEAQRQTPKVEPVAEDLPKEEPDAGPPPERTDA